MSFTQSLDYEYQKKEQNYYQNSRPEMLRYIPSSARTLLDVGCSSGNFSYLLKQTRPVEIWGIEINQQAAAIASEKLDYVICAAFDQNLNLSKNYFDCIIFNDVLEHLVNPDAALQYAKELLSDTGVIIASIPNVRYFNVIWDLLVNGNWEYQSWGVLDQTHLRFFTHRSIVSTFTKLGYEIDCIEGINPLNSRKFSFLNRLLLNKIEDMRYLQFAVVARCSKK